MNTVNNTLIKSYIFVYGCGTEEQRDFTELQAWSVDTVLEPKGIPFNKAVELINKWNDQCARFKHPCSYFIENIQKFEG